MLKANAIFSGDLSPQRKLSLKVKKPILKVTATLKKDNQHKHNNSDAVIFKYNNLALVSKMPATATAKKMKEVQNLLFTKVKHDQDNLLSTTRIRKHQHNLTEYQNMQSSYHFKVPKPLEPRLSKQISSPHKLSEAVSASDSILKSFTPRKSIEDEKRFLLQNLKFPTNPATILKLFMHRMSNFEQVEIVNYHEIHFLGIGVNNLKDQIIRNYGYDDDKGDYKIIIGDHIAYRYEILSVLGRGSFGQVVKVIDHKTKKEVALKIIRNKERFQEQALVEINVLKYIKDRDSNDSYCVVHLDENFSFRKHMVNII